LIVDAMQSGVILPGELTVDLLDQEIHRVQAAQSRVNPNLIPVFLVDGFPRSMDNVQHFTHHVNHHPHHTHHLTT
jgi:hypothetical protein